MRTDLSVRAVHLGGMRVDVHVREQVLSMDYPAEAGRHSTPLEALLASLAACAANTLHLVLSNKLGVHLDRIEVEAHGERRVEHPTLLTQIELVYHLRGEKMDAELIDRAMGMAEGQLCPVVAMLRPGTAIASRWQRD